MADTFIKEGEPPLQVGRGFNWAAFFFPGIWAFCKGRYLAGWIGIGLPVLAGIAPLSGAGASWLVVVVGLFIGVLYGTFGNGWVAQGLLADGYIATSTPFQIDSSTPETVSMASSDSPSEACRAPALHNGPPLGHASSRDPHWPLVVAALSLAFAFGAAWMLRFEVNTANKNTAWILDRWTGAVLYCSAPRYGRSCEKVN